MGKIATYRDCHDFFGGLLPIEPSRCPTKADILARWPKASIPSSYSDNQLVQLEDLSKDSGSYITVAIHARVYGNTPSVLNGWLGKSYSLVTTPSGWYIVGNSSGTLPSRSDSWLNGTSVEGKNFYGVQLFSIKKQNSNAVQLTVSVGISNYTTTATTGTAFLDLT